MMCTGGYGWAAAKGPAAFWERVGEWVEEAHSESEFRVFQVRYPEYFAEEDAARVAYAFVRRERYLFRGPSRCPAGDPRLFHEVISHGACLGGGDGEGQCFEAMGGEGLPAEDPCADAEKRAAR